MCRSTPRWWTRKLASVCDPISLEPIRAMRYPPFELRADPEAAHGAPDSDWYDGKLLAHYCVSTGNFTHPISRRELTRAECEAMDSYLAANRLGDARVTHAFDHREEYNAPGGRPASVAELQAEASSVLQSLFAGTSARREARARAAARPASDAVASDGNISFVDDDRMPAHATSSAGVVGAHNSHDAHDSQEPAGVADDDANSDSDSDGTTTTEPLAPAEAFPVLGSAPAFSVLGSEPAFPVLGSEPPPVPSRHMAGGGGFLRRTPVQQVWSVAPPAPHPPVSGRGPSGWSSVAGSRPAGATSAAASTARPALANSTGGWAGAASRPAGSGIIHSVGRGPTTDGTAAAPAKSKGQKKAAAKQRKAREAAVAGGGGGDEDAEEEETAAEDVRGVSGGGVSGGSSSSSSGGGGSGGGSSGDGGGGSRSGGGRGGAASDAAPARSVTKPASVEEAKARNRLLMATLSERLQQAGFSSGETSDALKQFKAASKAFVSASDTAAAHAYLELFLGLFGDNEGSLALLLELASLMPSPTAYAALSSAICAKWELSSFPVASPLRSKRLPAATAPDRLTLTPQAEHTTPSTLTSTTTPAGARQHASLASFHAPPLASSRGGTHGSLLAAAQAAAASYGYEQAAVHTAAPTPKCVLATGPTYGSAKPAASTLSARQQQQRAVQQQQQVKGSRKPATSAPVAPRVTLAYAAARQTEPTHASGGGGGSGGSTAAAAGAPKPTSSSAAAAAAAAAAQFDEEFSFGSTAALRAAMQYRR